jgi:hypothetical protein
MSNFAVIENNLVVNIIVAESKNLAEEVTGKTCIEYTDDSLISVGSTYIDGIFTLPKPHPSWILVDNMWNPPVEKPLSDPNNPVNYFWNEETVSWDIV